MTYLKTSEFQIRDWAPADIQIFKEYLNSEKVWIQMEAPWISKDSNFNHEIEIGQRELFNSNAIKMSLPICDIESNKMIGFVNAYWRSIETNWMRVGIRLFDSQYWGKGIGYKALHFWVDYNFAKRPELARLEMTTWSGNQAISRLALKLGFQLEACHREARNHEGKKFDAVSYGILRNEWNNS